MKYILVTGGCGFIGSHTSVLLLNNNYNIIIIDNLHNSKESVIDNIKKITHKYNIIFFKRNLCDNIDDIFQQYNIIGVIHFASLKSVNESTQYPLKYYNNNIMSTINLLNTMEKYKCYNLIFSSSATVYGTNTPPFKEIDEIGKDITNPYGKTKYMLENILLDITKSNTNFKIISLRYFNPVGAHPSGLIGENPNNIPNNLMPHILNVAYSNFRNNISTYLLIYGNNYNTPDGTCIRDYIHVMDIAESHILAFNYLNNMKSNYDVINIGLGKGTSILELIHIFEQTNKVKIPYKIMDKRPGDVPISLCCSIKSKEILNFTPKYNLTDICKHVWNYKLNYNK